MAYFSVKMWSGCDEQYMAYFELGRVSGGCEEEYMVHFVLNQCGVALLKNTWHILL